MEISTDGLENISLNPLEEVKTPKATEEVQKQTEEQEEQGEQQEEQKIEKSPKEESSSLTETEKVEKSQSAKPIAEYEKWATDNGFISPEDVEIKIEEALSSVKLSPTIQKLIELEKNGHDITNPRFLSKLNADYSKYNPYKKEDALELLKAAEMERNPKLTEKQAEERILLEYDELFSGDFEEGDREYKKVKIRMEKDAEAALTKLEESKVSLPATNTKPTEQEIRQYDALVKRGRGQFERVVRNHISNNNKIQFKYGNESIDFDLSDEEQAQIQSQIIKVYDSNPNGWLSEDGLNRGLIKEDELTKSIRNLVLLDDKMLDKFLTKLAKNNKVEGKKEEIKELKNSKPPEAGSITSNKSKSREEREAEEINSKVRPIF